MKKLTIEQREDIQCQLETIVRDCLEWIDGIQEFDEKFFWEENHKELVKITDALQKLDRKYDQTIGALGTRWGLHAEASFRNALAGIRKDDHVEVLNGNDT